jgi:hypothetical protein
MKCESLVVSAISAIWWYPCYRESKRKRDNISETTQNNSKRESQREKRERSEGGLATIKGGHGGCVIWTCVAEPQKGQHHGHVWEYSEGQSRRI